MATAMPRRRTNHNEVSATNGAKVVELPNRPNSTKLSGEVVVDANVVRYSGLSVVDDQLASARRAFNFTVGRDNVMLQDDPVANNSRSQLVRGATSLTFTHSSSSLSINLGGGNDTLQVRGADAAISRVLNVDAKQIGHESAPSPCGRQSQI